MSGPDAPSLTGAAPGPVPVPGPAHVAGPAPVPGPAHVPGPAPAGARDSASPDHPVHPDHPNLSDDPVLVAPEVKAGILVEALPYIRRFWGQIVVVKYGGNILQAKGDSPAIDEDAALASFAEDIVLMRSVGMLPVVVHGGGPQIGQLMARVGKSTEFRDGFRVTDADTLDLVRMVLVGKVNRDIVKSINVHGALAVGLSGEDANLITATARSASLGYVGDVVEVDPVLLHQLLAQGLIPVVATIGTDLSGQAFNINADTVAGALAGALDAAKLVFLTDVAGVRSSPEDPDSLIPRLSADALAAMVDSGAATGGMIPKAEACIRAIRAGVGQAHILDGRVPHALLLEIFTDAGVGTMVRA